MLGGGVRPRRALLFVVLIARRIHCVMKPKREFHFVNMFGEMTRFIQPQEAFVEMLRRVLAPVRLGIAGDHFLVE